MAETEIRVWCKECFIRMENELRNKYGKNFHYENIDRTCFYDEKSKKTIMILLAPVLKVNVPINLNKRNILPVRKMNFCPYCGKSISNTGDELFKDKYF